MVAFCSNGHFLGGCPRIKYNLLDRGYCKETPGKMQGGVSRAGPGPRRRGERRGPGEESSIKVRKALYGPVGMMYNPPIAAAPGRAPARGHLEGKEAVLS